MKRHWIWFLAIIVVIAVTAFAWLSLRGPQNAAIEMRYAPLVRSLQFSALVATLSRVDVGSTITARVVKVLADDGAEVRRGDLLVQLETDELRAALAQAQANERQAKARLAGLRTTGRAAATAAVMQADATQRAAQSELARNQQLVAQGFISAARLDEVQRTLDVARAQQASAQAQLRANADVGADVLQAQAQLDQALAAITSSQARLAQAEVVAPADARVLTRQVEPGQIVQPGKALMSLALAGPTQLIAQVDERFLEQLRIGQSTRVVADAFPGQRFDAHVLSIAPSVDAQRGAIEVKFSLDQQAPAFLREDMTLSVEVETATRARALVLPLSALRSQTGGSSAAVLIAQDGRAEERSVRLGLRTLDAAEVLEGLAEGDTVLLAGEAQAGKRVRLNMQSMPSSVVAGESSGRSAAASASAVSTAPVAPGAKTGPGMSKAFGL